MRYRLSRLACCIAILLIATTGHTQETENRSRIAVQMRPLDKREGKLAPELQLVKETQGVLVALTEANRAVLDIPRDRIQVVFDNDNVLDVDRDMTAPLVPLRLIISYKKDGRDAAHRAIESSGLRIQKDYEKGSFFIAATAERKEGDDKLPQQEGITAQMVRSLEDSMAIDFVAPSYQIRLDPPRERRGARVNGAAVRVAAATGPDDPRLADLWGMTNIKAPQAWSRVTEAPNVVVAVIDTGIDFEHPDLKANVAINEKEANGQAGQDDDGNGVVDDIHGANFVGPGDPTGNCRDDHKHGTHCAGTVAAVGNNATGVVGVTWRTGLLAVKFLNANGSGTTEDAIESIDYVTEQQLASPDKRFVISASWGGGGYDLAMENAIGRAEQAGILFVAAAGNSASDNDAVPHYPSSYGNENIIAVAAIDDQNDLAYFSCYGIQSVDLAAPGDSILSTLPSDMFSDPYGILSGTSMATPHVTGAIALAYGHPMYQTKSWQEVEQALYDNGRELPSLAGKIATGKTLDVSFLESGGGTTPTCCPVVASGHFLWTDAKTAGGVANITSATFTLDREMTVFVRANSSVTSQFDNRFTTGFSNDADPNQMWDQSLRFVSIPAAGQWINFGSAAAVQLPAGEHTIYWHVFVEGGDILFDSGSLIVEAFDASSTTTVAASPKLVPASSRGMQKPGSVQTGSQSR